MFFYIYLCSNILTPLPSLNSALRVSFFLPKNEIMSKIEYEKEPLTYAQQLLLLKSRNLQIEDEPKALHLLKQLSYYRLSGYWYTLLKDPKKEHVFKDDASFNQAFKLYCFDRELRLLILNQIEKIEIAIRAALTYESSISWGAFWLADKDNFNSFSNYTSTINKIFGELKRSKELFLNEYQKSYNEELPPSWITLEVCSFGNLSWVYSIIKSGRTKKAIASNFGLSDKVFQSWLHSLVYLRNTCAHHSRLWNKKLAIRAELPRRTDFPWINNFEVIDTRTGKHLTIMNRSYFAICMVQYFIQTINPTNTFRDKLLVLFDKYPLVDINALGFTEHWKDEPMWR